MNKVGILVTFGLLAVVIAMTIVIFIPKHCAVARMEGFAVSAASPAMGTTTCPRGTRSYTDRQGNLNCCSGEVTGNFCEGAIACTFSSGMGDSVPICNAVQLQRKYTGPIDPIVNMILDKDRGFLSKLINNYMPEMITELRKAPSSQVSKETLDRFIKLQQDEKQYIEKIGKDFWEGKLKLSIQELDQLAKEEVMYIFTQSMDIFKSSPIANNKNFIQEQLQKQVCTK